MKRYIALLAVLLGMASMAAQAREVPVADFFKKPEFTSVSLSPTGEYITVSVPQEDRTVLAAFRVEGMQLVGKWDWGPKKHIDEVVWVNDKRFFMYVSKKEGRFDRRRATPDVYASNVDGKQRADIPNGGYYSIVDLLEDDDSNILVSRSAGSAFLSRMNVNNGSVRTVASSPLYLGGFLVDHDANLRYAIGMSEKREVIILRRDSDGWGEVSRTPETKTERAPMRFAADNKRIYYSVSRDGKPTEVVLVDPETGEERPVTSNPNVDPSSYIISGDGRHVLAVRYQDGLPSYAFVAPEHPEAKAIAGLVNAFPDHAVSIADISRDGRFILFGTFSDVDPESYYLFDRQEGRAQFLLSAANWLKPEELAPTKAISLTARDGTKLHGYLTVPRHSQGRGLPMVLFIHGGPTARDVWGYDPDVQFLANRGYAVLQVNFRGSTGYGSGFMLQGDKHWGTTMIDDMADAVDWAIARGVADKDRVCTYGASYGGYAALQSVVRYPGKYACSIGYVGVYSLPLMRKDGDIKETNFGLGQLARQLPDSVAEQQAQSPAFNAHKIRGPVMLVHGAKDERVPIAHYELLKRNLEQAGNPPEVTIVKPKEEHGFVNLQNNIELYTAMEAFLDKHIGDRRSVAGTAD
jgi:dipeptidyl aminopeptidase/acylaminoacyl peptidase